MSQLKAKQIAGPSSGKVGSAILFDGTKSGWSADLNTALSLPSGPTSARPQTAAGGHIRHNSETGKLEGFNGTSWIDLGISKFTELADGPGAFQAGKVLRTNSAGTALEYFDMSTHLKAYRFRTNFTGNTIPTDFAEVPAGWNISATGSTINITHNVAKAPVFFATYGSVQASNNYQLRNVSGVGGTVLGMTYDGSTLANITLSNVTTSNVSSYSGGHCYVYLYFMYA